MDDDEFTEVFEIPMHGGARQNAGRKPAGVKKADEVIEFDKARARNEAAKAGLNELKLKIDSKEYLSRTAFREASATLLAELAQALRSLPDTLERRHALPANIVLEIEKTIDEALATVASGLELFVDEEK